MVYVGPAVTITTHTESGKYLVGTTVNVYNHRIQQTSRFKKCITDNVAFRVLLEDSPSFTLDYTPCATIEEARHKARHHLINHYLDPLVLNSDLGFNGAVYTLTHRPSGSYYVGSSTFFSKRRDVIVSLLEQGEHPNVKLQALHNADGIAAFEWALIGHATRSPALQALEREFLAVRWGDQLLLNTSLDPDEISTGKYVSPTRRKSTSEQSKVLWLSDAMIQARATGNYPASRGVKVMGVEYPSITAASIALGVPYPTVTSRLNSLTQAWKEWEYLDGITIPHRNYKNKKTPLWCAYHLTHLETGKFYVGSTGYWTARKNSHFSSLSLRKHANLYLQQTWDLDPRQEAWSTFIMVFDCREKMLDQEQAWIDEHVDSPLLLNRATNSRSPIAGLRGDPNVKSLRPRPRKLKTVKELMEFRAEQGARMREYWANPDNLAKRMGGGNPFAKKITIDGVTYGSVNDAERAGIASIKTIRRRANSELWPGYSWT